MAGQKQMLGGCCVCLDERGWKENPLVYCDGNGCDIAVHKNCYGITKVPAGPWFCQKCASKETGDHVRCCLCPNTQGVLKKTDDGRWAHVLCALYIPEIRFGNVTTMEPIIVTGIPLSSFDSKSCYVCEEAKRLDKHYGVCLQCFKPSCKVIFHVSCGQIKGLLVEEQGLEPDSVQYCGYCGVHAKKSKSGRSTAVSSPSLAQVKHSSIDTSSNHSSDDKKSLNTPLTVEISNAQEKPKARSRARPPANRQQGEDGAAKPKRSRKPATTKKNAAATVLSKLSPQLKSPLRSPLRSPGMRGGMRSPGMRSPMLLSPGGRSPISLVPNTSVHGLLEQQFELGKKMLEDQAPLDIAQLLSCINKMQQENQQLEAELQQLTARRDHLVSVNARLSLPLSTSMAAPTSAAAPIKHDNTLPAVLSNGTAAMPSLSTSLPIADLPRHSQAHVSVPQSVPAQSIANPVQAMPQPGAPRKIVSSVGIGSRETAAAQPRKRTSESVIKVNSKQVKMTSTPPAMNKPSAKAPTNQSKATGTGKDGSSHFQWPAPLVSSTATSSAPVPPSLESTYIQSVSSRLPPINALSQSRVPPQQMSVATPAAYMNNSPAMANYTNNVNAAAAMAANYGTYPQFPMFSMGDMATLNPNALTGLAMQGLHNSQAYYRTAGTDTTAAHNAGSKPGLP